MLQERKTKKKYTLNPRGNEWANNDSKLGQKLIEKMGWSKGKGLGKNEDGIVECIRASTQMDKKGIGSANNAGDNWIAAQDEYSAILANLNQAYGTTNDSKKENECTNLEEKCKNSTSRIYYSKTIKSKNLSTKSKKDLDCILGRFKKEKTTSDDEVKGEEDETKGEQEQSEEPGNLVKGTTDIYKIYAQKMAAIREKVFGSKKDVKESEEAPAESPDLTESTQPSESVEESDEAVGKISEKKKKKKKRVEENVEAIDETPVEVKKEKKKKRKRDEVDDGNGENVDLNVVVQPDEVDCPKSKKAKKLKSASRDVGRTTNDDVVANNGVSVVVDDDCGDCVSNKDKIVDEEAAAESGVDRKKSKKKKKSKKE